MAKDVALHASTVSRQFRQLSRSLPNLLMAVVSREDTSTTKSGRRRPRLSPSWRRTLKLQGKYMGTMRGLGPRQASRVKKVRVQKGIRAAIALARSLY